MTPPKSDPKEGMWKVLDEENSRPPKCMHENLKLWVQWHCEVILLEGNTVQGQSKASFIKRGGWGRGHRYSTPFISGGQGAAKPSLCAKADMR
ncbi:Hypothetical predicted protein [Podarcis lilfordi]|uniref:Uncharacterized protein n=1 Tax=Podarcis lilfordi TaxID=74358 RepID=A0AA35KP47_9SAUR|nr:Hypothetical predicted protein [Podarcis lilfordi]